MMKTLVKDWLSSHKGQITLFEGDDEIMLKRQGGAVLLEAQLTATPCANAALSGWMRLSAVSLNHFQGALALKPDTGALWLIQSLQGTCDHTNLLNCLQALLNQRDTSRSTAVRLTRQVKQLTPTSLRSMSY